MINKSKLALITAVGITAVGLAIASPAFAQPVRSEHHRHIYNYVPNQQIAPGPGAASNPLDDPSMTGGGSAGYNACGGHPRC